MSDRDKGKPSKSVMGNLPSTRPTRMGRRRDGEPTADGEATAKPVAAKRTPAAARSKPKPGAVRSGSPSLDAAKKQSTARKRREPAVSPPKGAELVTTAVQATGE